MNYIKYLSIPYEPLGSSPLGADCYGLVSLVYSHEYGINLPRLAYQEEWFKENPKLILEEYKNHNFKLTQENKEGNILVFLEANIPKHLGIICNDEYFLHTTKNGTAVHSYVTGKWASKIFCKLAYKG